MDELIVCRKCDSPYCPGCNIYLLYQMLKAGKFDAIKDGKNTIIPAADVRPVLRGKWLRTPTYWAYCSVCGEEPPDDTNTTTNFCPNCGALMDKDGDGDGTIN